MRGFCFLYIFKIVDLMRVSKYIKVDKNVLIEYIYDDNNLIGEAYNIGVNSRNRNQNYMAAGTSGTINTQRNTLFLIDSVANTYGVFDTDNYNFLQVREYASGFPIRHDTIKIYFPINYVFGEYQGMYLRVYGLDVNNQFAYDLSNFFYDISNLEQNENNSIIDFVAPPLYFQEKLWGKSIELNVPSLYSVANQRGRTALQSNAINTNLTQGIGFNQQSPIFIDFRFITSKATINNVSTYTLSARRTFSIPQSPEFESIGLTIEESKNGDFFEIYATYNGNIGEFNDFINRSVSLGNRYYLQYDVTTFEQNIKNKTQRIIVTEDFLNKVEYRPIIKTSTTTAIIDVEMNLIDAVNDSRIIRRSSFGMLQDMVSKYSARLMKINVSNANKPKIYNLKQTITAQNNNNLNLNNNPNITQLEVIKVPYPVLIDRFNVIAKTETEVLSNQNFWGIGKMMLTVYPFDNIFKFVIAQEISRDLSQIQYMDLSNLGEIKLIFKNQNLSVDCPVFTETGENDLSIGFVVFKLTAAKIPDLRKIYDSGVNVFYITSTQLSTTTVIYSGLFKIYDSVQNVSILQGTTAEEQVSVAESPNATTTALPVGDAFARRRIVETVTTELPNEQTGTTLVNTINQRLDEAVVSESPIVTEDAPQNQNPQSDQPLTGNNPYWRDQNTQ
jgi:hypothetical protein